MRHLLAALVVFLGLSSSAHAEILASRPTFNKNANVVRCVLYNAGSTPVAIRAQRVVAEVAPLNLPLASQCPATLAAGGRCTFAAAIVSGGAHLCLADLSSKAAVRGQMSLIFRLSTYAVVEMR